MVKISENKIWRIVARINDEIIVKQAGNIEKATRSARNAVCQRLCDSAGTKEDVISLTILSALRCMFNTMMN